MLRADARGERRRSTSWLVRHSPGGSTSFGPSLDVLVAAALVEVVVLHEHRRGQHDVGHQGRLGHELLVHADEQVLAGEAPLHAVPAPGATETGLVFWISIAVTGRAVAQAPPDRR